MAVGADGCGTLIEVVKSRRQTINKSFTGTFSCRRTPFQLHTFHSYLPTVPFSNPSSCPPQLWRYVPDIVPSSPITCPYPISSIPYPTCLLLRGAHHQVPSLSRPFRPFPGQELVNPVALRVAGAASSGPLHFEKMLPLGLADRLGTTSRGVRAVCEGGWAVRASL